MGRCDPGDQILLKYSNARNRFKSNGSIGLIVTNPMQLIWVQMEVGSERYHVLFKMENRQKRDADCTSPYIRTDDDMEDNTDDVADHTLT